MNWSGIALLVPLLTCGQSITGKIVDPIPAPLPGLVVGLLPVRGDWVTKSTRTGSGGEFRFFPIEPGEYVIIVRAPGWRSRVRAVRVSGGADADLGTLELGIASCGSTGVCDYVTAPPPRPPVPVVDLCSALKHPDRYGSKLIVTVGMVTTLYGWPTLTATCDSALASGGLTWTNSVLLPEGAAPQRSPTLPNIPDLKKKLADLAAAVRRTGGSATARVAAAYGFLDVPDGLTVVPCASNPCPARPDILMPPASFLRVDGFQELK